MTRALLLLCAVWLSACGPMVWDVPTDPESFAIEPAAVSHLPRTPRLMFDNGYGKGEGKLTINPPHGRAQYVFEQRDMTDTAIAVLRRAMEKHGISVAPQASKRITLRVHSLGMGFQMMAGTTAHLVLDARLGDGTTLSIPAVNRSPASPQRAFDGAILFALNKLVLDQRFVAYLGH